MSEQLQERGTDKRGDRNGDGWAAWDDVPVDYPAIFVLDTETLDERGIVHGAWLRVDQPHLGSQLAALLGRTPSGWAVVDQVGLGGFMMPESFNPDELPDVLHKLEVRR